MVDPLAPHSTLSRPAGPVVLCILDGVGLGEGGEDDAVATARTPTLDRLRETGLFCALRAHGTAVGLPSDADMGNSEVGHNAIGAGRVFDQGAKLVDHALLDTGSAFESEVWQRLVQGNTLHFLGLFSDGRVHSRMEHLRELVRRAYAAGVKRVRLHILTDGRDVGPRTALTWIEPMEAELAAYAGVDYRIASGGGRMHLTMDRYEADWGMVERGWDCHVRGVGQPFASASEAVQALYDADPDIDDQHLPAFVVVEDGEPVGRIVDGDSVCFFNFRGDRAIEISRAFTDDDLDTLTRADRPDVYYAGMMEYDGDLHVPPNYLVDPPAIDRTVGEYLAAAGLRSFVCSETQKYGHVTYFFNGNKSGRLDDSLETYLEVPSDTLPFEERPWMKAAEITDACIAAIESGDYDHVRLNLANGDMVGHTGVLEATRVAVEAVDLQVSRLEEAVRKAGGVLIVTADHGNADEMYLRKKGTVLQDAQGRPQPRTAHSLAQVPCYIVGADASLVDVPDAGIASVGSTVLALCGLSLPEGYLPALVG